jgi:hypothetical protein
MARQIVTQDVVDKAAEALVGEGLEPSIVAIQSRAGGGSFSTVKRYLDVWKQRRAEAAAAAPETPLPIRAKAEEFARTAWALACEEAQQETRQAKAVAAAEIAALRAELAEANTEIARLEANEARPRRTGSPRWKPRSRALARRRPKRRLKSVNSPARPSLCGRSCAI